MLQPHMAGGRFRPSLPFVLLCILFGTLWIAGGASRADVSGQIVVRIVAWLLLLVGLLWGERPNLREARPVVYLLCGALALPLLQLVPLPPGIWLALPGRTLLAEAAAASGQSQPWRPLSMVPEATINAASSLIVPMTALLFTGGLKERERALLPNMLLGVVTASMLVGLLQFSGGAFNNPFINEKAADVSGNFANRNHFALFMAFGCLLVPVWAFRAGRQSGWRGPIALGLVALFVLTILASGSRVGVLLGIVGLLIGVVIVWRSVRRAFARYPRWVMPVVFVGVIALLSILVGLSVAADRAISINRAIGVDIDQDMRTRALPIILDLVHVYFPFGTGLGSFDPIFRIHEPAELLRPTYFNHAHNDLLEIMLDAGLLGAGLLLAGILWLARASFASWRDRSKSGDENPRIGSAILLLIFVASAFDYPARTPMMMAVMVVAGIWLSGGVRPSSRPALPANGQRL